MSAPQPTQFLPATPTYLLQLRQVFAGRGITARHFSQARRRNFAPPQPPKAVPTCGRRLSPPFGHCGGFVRPNVVWFGEDLPVTELQQAFKAAQACDLLISIGTSGVVQPAARIPALAKQARARVVQINPTEMGTDFIYTWSLQGAAGDVMPRLLREAFANR